MTGLYDAVVAVRDKARVDKDKEPLVCTNTYLGDVDRVVKGSKTLQDTPETRDAQMLTVLQTHYKSVSEDIGIRAAKQAEGDMELVSHLEESRRELGLLTKLIPEDKVPLANSQLEIVLKEYLLTAPTGQLELKHVMAWLGKTYAGRYDGKQASALVKELLK